MLFLILLSQSGAILPGRGINKVDNKFIDDNLKRLLALSTNE